MRKFLSVLLAMAMVLSLTVTGFAIEDTATTREPEVMTEEATMAGKTVILHTNDVHGAIAATPTSPRSRPIMRPRAPRSSSLMRATTARARAMSA